MTAQVFENFTAVRQAVIALDALLAEIEVSCSPEERRELLALLLADVDAYREALRAGRKEPPFPRLEAAANARAAVDCERGELHGLSPAQVEMAERLRMPLDLYAALSTCRTVHEAEKVRRRFREEAAARAERGAK